MAATGKILITGCQGQLGMDLMACLGESSTVMGVDQQDVDVIDYSALVELFRAVRPEWVIHTAAYTDVDGCEANPGLAMATNADGTENVARAAVKVGAKVLYYSTDYVFDGAASAPYVETSPANPQTAYGRSKLAGEERVVAWIDNYVIMRIAWVYGQYGRNFVKTMVRLARERLRDSVALPSPEPIKVVNDQVGNPTWTMEIAAQTKVLLEGGLFGLFHATSEGQASWYHFAREIMAQMRLPIEIEACTTVDYPRPARRPCYSVLENQRLKEAGMNVMRPYREALADFIKQYGDRL